MELVAAVVLGIVQGLTEFLPVSSSAHLILVPLLLGWNPEGIAFDVALHLGTCVALLAYFWRDWVDLAREAVVGLARGAPLATPRRKLAWFLVVGTIPAAVVGLTLEETVETHLRSPGVIVVALVLFAAVLALAERRSRQTRSIDAFDLSDSIWIGLSQALALVPGVSRSGVTISTALLRDADRVSAARFSFLLSTPVILGAGLKEGWKLLGPTIQGGAGAPAGLSWLVVAVGTASAAVTGFVCIGFFLRYLQTRSYRPFVLYRVILAGIVLAVWLRHS